MLRILKETRTYDGPTEPTGLPAGDLDRYVSGRVLPGVERTHEVVESVGRGTFADEPEARIRFDDEGYVDDSGTVFDQSFPSLVALVATNALDLECPDMILAAVTGGITLGAAMVSYFGARLAYAKRSKETAVEDFVGSRQRLTFSIELIYYLLAGAIDNDECVLVIDDPIRSGETQELLLDIALQADTDITGVFALIVVGDGGTNHACELVNTLVGMLSSLD